MKNYFYYLWLFLCVVFTYTSMLLLPIDIFWQKILISAGIGIVLGLFVTKMILRGLDK